MQDQMTHAEAVSKIAELVEENERLRDALRRIVEMTDADNPDSYRCDDREGCFDAVYSVATNTLTTPNAVLCENWRLRR